MGDRGGDLLGAPGVSDWMQTGDLVLDPLRRPRAPARMTSSWYCWVAIGAGGDGVDVSPVRCRTGRRSAGPGSRSPPWPSRRACSPAPRGAPGGRPPPMTRPGLPRAEKAPDGGLEPTTASARFTWMRRSSSLRLETEVDRGVAEDRGVVLDPARQRRGRPAPRRAAARPGPRRRRCCPPRRWRAGARRAIRARPGSSLIATTVSPCASSRSTISWPMPRLLGW